MDPYWTYVMFYGSAMLAGLILAAIMIGLTHIHPALAIIFLVVLIVFGAPALATSWPTA